MLDRRGSRRIGSGPGRRRAGAWLAGSWALLLFVLGWGCQQAEQRQCISGETRECTGAGDCPGAQSCNADGRSFGACACGVAISPAPADAPARECTLGDMQACVGAGGCAGTRSCSAAGSFSECICPPPPVSPGPLRLDVLGAPCTTDTDCGSDLFCWTESSQGLLGLPGGPAGGYCTARCQQDPECSALEQFGGCVTFAMNTPGLCFAGCFSQVAALGDDVKCRARNDVGCWSYSELFGLPQGTTSIQLGTQSVDRGVCFPKCDSDEDCPGRRCNRAYRVALCTDQPPPAPAGAIGAPCTGPSDCTGSVCRALEGGANACSATCVVGSPSNCGFGASAPERDAACVLPFEWEGGSNFGFGNIGLCAELCTVNSDCTQPGFVCEPSTMAGIVHGICNFHAPEQADAGTSDGGAQ